MNQEEDVKVLTNPQQISVEEPKAEELLRQYIEQAKETIAGTAAAKALEAYERAEPLIPRAHTASNPRFATGGNS